jgi:hypothetical protein
MAFTPTTKKSGDQATAAEWNALVGETQRLGDAKLDRAAASVDGELSVNALTVTGTITMAAASLAGSKVKPATVPAAALADGSLPGAKLNTMAGTEIKDGSLPGTRLTDNSVTADRLSGGIPPAKLMPGVPASVLIDNTIGGSTLKVSIQGTRVTLPRNSGVTVVIERYGPGTPPPFFSYLRLKAQVNADGGHDIQVGVPYVIYYPANTTIAGAPPGGFQKTVFLANPASVDVTVDYEIVSLLAD